MIPGIRRFIPWVFGGLLVGATGWALTTETLPPADFTFCNETEIQTLDPATVTGVPEGRVIAALFEGLCRRDPVDLHPIAGAADDWKISADGLTYRFHIRDDARWSDGSPVTAEDFYYTFRRFLAPETFGEYAYQLWYVRGAKRYSTQDVQVGERVEVELPREAGVGNTVRGRLLDGVLKEKTVTGAGEAQVVTYGVEIDGAVRKFSADRRAAGAERCTWVLPHFDLVGVKVEGPRQLTLTLEHATPYFLDILAFYPLSAVNRRCLETHGAPQWTHPENIVSNGAFRLERRRIRDRVRLVKNEHYWNRNQVKLNVVDVLAVEGVTTMLNMYLTGEADWITDIPPAVAQTLMSRRPKEFEPTAMLGTYFYRFNTTKPPFDDPRVRKALTLAIDREAIVKTAARMGQIPARSLVPPGIKGYEPAKCDPESVIEARRLLAEAGYPEGRGFPHFDILYNTQEAHRSIAEMLQDAWKRELGIDVGLRNQEWGVFLDTVRSLDYQTARASWIGDYVDPNTFLELFMSTNENNQTGWKNEEYDRLLNAAAEEGDDVKRAGLFHEAETILMRELPILPIYYYVSKDMVRTYVRGFHKNVRDEHPLWAISVDFDEKRRVLAEVR